METKSSTFLCPKCKQEFNGNSDKGLSLFKFEKDGNQQLGIYCNYHKEYVGILRIAPIKHEINLDNESIN